MTLPNFIGIGPQRSGSTWLYQQLRNHPEVYMSDRKEINFFDKNYHKGVDWYKKFFSDSSEKKFLAVGEVSPAYLYSEKTPELIYHLLPDVKFISILRNPSHRAFSQYKYAVRNNKEQRRLLEYLQQTDVIERGFYSEQIQKYYKFFPAENFLFLIFEEIMSDPCLGLSKIAMFLDIDSNKFDSNLATKKINSSENFRFEEFSRFVRKILKKQREKDFLYNDYLINILKDIYIKLPVSILQKNDEIIFDSESYALLSQVYEPEVLRLEKILNINLSVWK